MASPKKIKRIDTFEIAIDANPNSYFIGIIDGKICKIPNNYSKREENPIEIKTYTRDIDE